MTWTWSESDIDGNLPKIRALIGDTVSASQILSDEMINYCTSLAGNPLGMAAHAATMAAAKFAREANKEVGDLKIEASQKATAYRELARDLRKQSIKLVGPVAGGISIASKKTQTDDTDRVKPGLSKGQFENPSTGSRFSDLS